MRTKVSFIRLLLLFIFLTYLSQSEVFSGQLSFKVSIIYTKGSQELNRDLREYKKKLQTALNEFDWKFPDLDFEKIETSINYNIESNSSETAYNGMLSISSGLTTKTRSQLPYKKTIYHNEKELSSIIDYENNPSFGNDLESYPTEFNSLESILKFYITLSLAQSLDKLSYTNTRKFKLKGEEYLKILYGYESEINKAENSNKWRFRKEIIEDYKLKRKDDIRRLNALLFNAKFFYNKGEKDRAALFIEPMVRVLKKISKDEQESFFKTFYFDIGKIFALEKESQSFTTLKNLDKANLKFYNSLK